MPYQIDAQEQDGFLRVEISGERVKGRELADGVATLSRIAELCRQKENSRVMLIVDLPGEVPPMVAFKMGEAPGSYGWCRTFKTAVVDLHEQSREASRFTETVAVNRGYLLKVFACEQEAKEWLLPAREADS